MKPIVRPRRNRNNASIRNLVRETKVYPSDFIWPLFIIEGKKTKQEIAAMPGVYRWSLDLAIEEAIEAHKLGIPGIALFPCVANSQKDPHAQESYNDAGLMSRSIRGIKEACPELLVIGDVAMDPYSSEGHDGLLKNGEILNDESLEILAKMALCQARAGVDLVAPSDMMDGRVAFIRNALDKENFSKVGILAYTAKYCSAFYGPFREALDSAPKSGDKKTYQMDPANRREALRELNLDLSEGADIVMVKPALAYLDIISDLKTHSHIPVAAYQVSGEYSMLKAAAEKGFINEKLAFLECLTSIKRAGADMIFSYWAKEFCKIYNDI